MTEAVSPVVPFDFDGQMVRVVEKDGQPWFVATDVAKVLGYRNAPDMVRILDEDERRTLTVRAGQGPDTHNVRSRGGADTQNQGGNQAREVNIISESGVFHAILKSRKPGAKAFRRWVTGDLLPSLRRDGYYSITPPSTSTVARLEHSDRTARRRELPGLLDRYHLEAHPEKRRILFELIRRACEVEGIDPPTPDSIRPLELEAMQTVQDRFDTALRKLGKLGVDPNQHRKGDLLLAINLPGFMALCAQHGIETPSAHALRTMFPRHPDFERSGAVNCTDGETRHCWLFRKPVQLSA